VDGEIVRIPRPTAIAPDDVRSGVVVLDEVGLHRPERGRCDRRADRPSHDASSRSPEPSTWPTRRSRAATTGRRIRGCSDTATPFGSETNSTRRRPIPRFGRRPRSHGGGAPAGNRRPCSGPYLPGPRTEVAPAETGRVAEPAEVHSALAPPYRYTVAWEQEPSGHVGTRGVGCARSHRPRDPS
jgi:hypothetical protein